MEETRVDIPQEENAEMSNIKYAEIQEKFLDTFILYAKLCSGAYIMRKEVETKYETEPAENRAIDVRLIAKEYGINIRERNLDILDLASTESLQLGMLLGKMDYEAPEGKTIHIEEGISESRKRYVIAHELGHYWLDKEYKVLTRDVKVEKCTDTRIPRDYMEILADIFAIFLMLPIKSLFEIEEIYLFINDRRPVNLEEMLAYVSDIAEIPYYQVLTGYEYIRMLICGWIYFMEHPSEEKESVEKIEKSFLTEGDDMQEVWKNLKIEIEQIDRRFFA